MWLSVQLAWRASPRLALGVLLLLLVQALLPSLNLVLYRLVLDRAALGVGHGTIHDPLAAHLSLLTWIACAAMEVVLAQLLQLVAATLQAMAGDRLTAYVTEQVIRAANRWPGLARFEDPTFADDLHRTRTAASRGGLSIVTTLPAKARRFRVVRKRLLQQELLRLRMWQPTALTPEGSIQAHWSGPCRPKGAAPLPVFLLSHGEVLNAISTAEHLKGPKSPSTRGMSYSRAFLVEPAEHIVCVKVPGSIAHRRLTATSFLLTWMVTSRAPTGARAYGIRIPLRHKCRSPPAEVFYGPPGVTEPGRRVD